ncbi:hypothetical protein AAVH_17001 [Aphelenchoides avenae]|nr:hypothetical protein AAVH_17001 [Aphelenchus avenae]
MVGSWIALTFSVGFVQAASGAWPFTSSSSQPSMFSSTDSTANGELPDFFAGQRFPTAFADPTQRIGGGGLDLETLTKSAAIRMNQENALIAQLSSMAPHRRNQLARDVSQGNITATNELVNHLLREMSGSAIPFPASVGIVPSSSSSPFGAFGGAGSGMDAAAQHIMLARLMQEQQLQQTDLGRILQGRSASGLFPRSISPTGGFPIGGINGGSTGSSSLFPSQPTSLGSMSGTITPFDIAAMRAMQNSEQSLRNNQQQPFTLGQSLSLNSQNLPAFSQSPFQSTSAFPASSSPFSPSSPFSSPNSFTSSRMGSSSQPLTRPVEPSSTNAMRNPPPSPFRSLSGMFNQDLAAKNSFRELDSAMDFGFPQHTSQARSNANGFKEGFIDEISDGFGRKVPFKDSVLNAGGLGSAESQSSALGRPSFGVGPARTRRTNDD